MAAGEETGGAIGRISGPAAVLIGAAVDGGARALTSVNTSPNDLELGSLPWNGSQ